MRIRNEEVHMARFTGNSVYPAQTPQNATSNQGLHLFATSNFDNYYKATGIILSYR